MKVWIDIDNSPHVPLLIPFIQNLEQHGHTVEITCRDYAQTIALLKVSGYPYTLIGKHGGAGKLGKIASISSRVVGLIQFARGKGFQMAINHGSRSQTIACKILGIACFVGMDYEHTESFIFSRFATKIWIPELLFPKALPAIGIRPDRAIVYPGIKEQFYLDQFVPSADFKSQNSISAEKVFIALRPPAELANYHDERSEVLLMKMIERVKQTGNTFTLCFPRTKEQAGRLRSYADESFVICDSVMDGKEVAYYADVMVSGGGTMNREAAFFGAQVFSIFSGAKPMIDLKLSAMGALTFIENESQINAITFQKKPNGIKRFPAQSQFVINHLISEFIKNTSHHGSTIRGSKAKLLVDQK